MKDPSPELRGPIAWMAKNHVPANVLMVALILGGALASLQVKQEVFPEFSLDLVSVSVPYPGASPAEVEQGIILSIEDAVRGLDGIKEVTSRANEGGASIAIELLTNTDGEKALQDIKNAVDRIQSFPELAERPVVSLIDQRNRVVSVIVHGDFDERTLRDVAERTRDDLLQLDGITQVELSGTRPLEIAIEIPEADLRAYGLTLPQVASIIGRTAIELPGGAVRTDGGEILLRTQERRDYAREYADIAVATSPDGTLVRLDDIATIVDGFEETDQETFFQGERAISIDVYRVGDETPQAVSRLVEEYVAERRADLPAGIGLATWNDDSEIYRDRMRLLIKNAFLGLALVLLILGLFLDPKLAFWVTLGIPISILGSFLFIPLTGASINMISLFAFIVSLGIIVDDAVVMGENIFERRQQGVPFLEAAILGAREIAAPICFAVLTNIAAFTPMFFIPGEAGNLFFQIPAVVIAVFTVSLVESIFVLPAHLAHPSADSAFWKVLALPNRFFSEWLDFVIRRVYAPSVRQLVRFRYATFAGGIAMIAVALSVVVGGHLPFSFLPKIDSDLVTVQAELPFGVPIETSRKVQRQLLDGVRRTIDEMGGDAIVRGIVTQIGEKLSVGPGAPPNVFGDTGAHLVGAQVSLVPADDRDFRSTEFASRWRENTGRIAGAESIAFNAEVGTGGGAAIDVTLSHRSVDVLEAAAAELAERLETYAGATDIDDGFAQGKPQLSFTVTPRARSLGLTSEDIAAQGRSPSPTARP